MTNTSSTPRLVEMLLAGPHGRRLLLEYALATELAQNPVRDHTTFGQALVLASSRSSPRVQGTGALLGEVRDDVNWIPSSVPLTEVAERLDLLPLAEPTPETLRNALTAAVGRARYWQEPDGEDLLATTSELSRPLHRVAKHIAASPLSAWWVTPVATRTQQALQWDDASPRPILSDVRQVLSANPAPNLTGEWWSRPPQVVPVSGRSLFDDSPAGLRFVEDDLGWDRAESTTLIVPEGVQVFEIGGADDWAQLCARFPLDVTDHKQENWYRATAHTSRWVVPNWAEVARHYDAVHLQVGAYLATAGVAIPIDVSPEAASVIAGWSPDETYWFTSDIAYGDEPRRWMLREQGTDMVWLPDPSAS